MCGIVGYLGKRNAIPILIEGLERLEYRGYDSAGIAFPDENGKMQFKKTVGRVQALKDYFAGEVQPPVLRSDLKTHPTVGIAHTRWATHGKPTEKNAHPHFDCTKNIFVVHNGIIENHAFLRDALEREGHHFYSETDTEVLAHLIERSFWFDKAEARGLEEAVSEALTHVRGTFGLVVISGLNGGKLVAARRGSPLLVGVGEEEFLIASDAAAILKHTRKIIYLQDNELAVITAADVLVSTLSLERVSRAPTILDWDLEDVERGGFESFMLKEIFEGPEVIENSLRGRLLHGKGGAKLGGLEDHKNILRNMKRCIIVACGTSYYAGMVGRYLLEEYAGIKCSLELASEFRYKKNIFDPDTFILAISQSGETADTLEALRLAKQDGIFCTGIVNVVGSTIARETDAGVYNHAGPEIGVASTKAFLSQLSVLALWALFLGRDRFLTQVLGQNIARELSMMPKKIRRILDDAQKIKKKALKYAHYDNFLFLGRKYSFPTALEGALKLKEISYVHAEGYAAGEMKHGPLALIDENFPVFVVVPSDSVFDKTVSNIQELRARSAPIIAIATEGDKEIASLVDDVIYIPKTLEMLTPILSVVPVQLFAYYIARARGRDVDKPRNLAKSVTVE